MISHILFDMDGTLIESGPGIIHSVEFALAALGEKIPSQETLSLFIGPPLRESFMEICGLSLERANQGIQFFRQSYKEHGILKTELYPGIPELLSNLYQEGFILHLATSKPDQFAQRILEDLELSPYFCSCHGSRMDESGPPKPQIVAEALSANQINPAAAIMVGDRLYDVEAAGANGMPCVGVLYGYGSREELTGAGAAYLAETVPDLFPLLQNLKG